MYRMIAGLLLFSTAAYAEPVSLEGINRAKEQCSAISRTNAAAFTNCVMREYEAHPRNLERRLEVDISKRPDCRESNSEIELCLAREGMIDPTSGRITYQSCIEDLLRVRGC